MIKMGYIKTENIVGIQTAEGYFCKDCLTLEDWGSLSESAILTEEDVEAEGEALYFCERCGEKIAPRHPQVE